MPARPEELTKAARLVATFMEPMPDVWYVSGDVKQTTHRGWWSTPGWPKPWEPCAMTLDRLHLVEARLTEEQWIQYEDALLDTYLSGDYKYSWGRFRSHTTAETKLLALAEVFQRGQSDTMRFSSL